jgi:hypothetical protein
LNTQEAFRKTLENLSKEELIDLLIFEQRILHLNEQTIQKLTEERQRLHWKINDLKTDNELLLRGYTD